MSSLWPALVSLPPRLAGLVERCAAVGGRALLVGGCVRDALRGVPTKDYDVEVHGLAPEALHAELKRLGRVDEVGRSFGVFKLRLGGADVDVSVPRRDRKVGAGHRGILAEADPHLGPREAARRRDLTVNAIAWDPRTAELVDPFGGLADLRARTLRAVDDTTFVEDPLRALRVAQFAARFAFTPHPALVALCRSMPLGGLPAERVRGEVEKLLLRAERPSLGWAFGLDAELWPRLLPAWARPCPPALDRLATTPVEGEPRRLAVMLAATADAPGLEDTLDRLGLHSWLGYDVRGQALALARARGAPPIGAPGAAGSESDGSVAPLPLTRARHLAESLEVELFAALTDDEPLGRAAAELGIGRVPLVPLVGGRDLVALGVPPGPTLGKLLAAIRAQQLDGHLSSPEAALAWARTTIR